MKKYFLVITILLVFGGIANAGMATFGWDAPLNAEESGCLGYTLFYKNTETGVEWSEDVPGKDTLQHTLHIPPGSWELTVEAYNSEVSSIRSSPPLPYVVEPYLPPNNPAPVVIQIQAPSVLIEVSQ